MEVIFFFIAVLGFIFMTAVLVPFFWELFKFIWDRTSD